MILILILLLLAFFAVIAVLALKPVRRDNYRNIRLITGEITSTRERPLPFVGESTLVFRIRPENSNASFPVEVSNRRLFNQLRQNIGQQVTVRVGNHPVTNNRWVLDVVEQESL